MVIFPRKRSAQDFGVSMGRVISISLAQWLAVHPHAPVANGKLPCTALTIQLDGGRHGSCWGETLQVQQKIIAWQIKSARTVLAV